MAVSHNHQDIPTICANTRLIRVWNCVGFGMGNTYTGEGIPSEFLVNVTNNQNKRRHQAVQAFSPLWSTAETGRSAAWGGHIPTLQLQNQSAEFSVGVLGKPPQTISEANYKQRADKHLASSWQVRNMQAKGLLSVPKRMSQLKNSPRMEEAAHHWD